MEQQTVEEMGETGLTDPEEKSPAEILADKEEEALQEFKAKVDFLMARIGEDPDVRDRIICETYVNIANMETAIRGTFQMFQDQGMASIVKGMFGRKKVKNAGGSEPDSE